MGVSVSSAISTARAQYSDLSATVALAYLQACHTDILTEVQLVKDSIDVTLIANQQMYAFTQSVLKVWAADYLTSVNNYRRLEQTSVRVLDQYNRTWREREAGDPISYFAEPSSAGVRQVGFYLKPRLGTDVDTSYPFVRMWVSQNQTLSQNAGTGLTTALPDTVEDTLIYTYYVWWKHSMIFDKENASAWRDLYLEERSKLKERTINWMIDVQPRNDPFIGQMARPR